MYVLSTTKLTKEIREQLIEKYPSVEFEFVESINEAEVSITKADILLTYGEDLTATQIEKAKQLKWIMVISAGMDEMPLKFIKEKGIKVTNARGIHQIPMAEYAISMLLHVYRQADTFRRNQFSHNWDRSVEIQEISNKTMTIVGAGAIGEELARLAKAFHMKTIGVSNSGKGKKYIDQMYQTSDVHEALKEADFVVSILPSTDETYYFYKQAHFNTMKETAVYLNMGRGNAVQSETLIMALDQNQISHAILDVYEQEPLPENHPLWDHPKVTMTPHVSGKSPYYITRAIAIFEENLTTYLNEEDLLVNIINLDRGY